VLETLITPSSIVSTISGLAVVSEVWVDTESPPLDTRVRSAGYALPPYSWSWLPAIVIAGIVVVDGGPASFGGAVSRRSIDCIVRISVVRVTSMSTTGRGLCDGSRSVSNAGRASQVIVDLIPASRAWRWSSTLLDGLPLYEHWINHADRALAACGTATIQTAPSWSLHFPPSWLCVTVHAGWVSIRVGVVVFDALISRSIVAPVGVVSCSASASLTLSFHSSRSVSAFLRALPPLMMPISPSRNVHVCHQLRTAIAIHAVQLLVGSCGHARLLRRVGRDVNVS
jgi:hypothetical protein